MLYQVTCKRCGKKFKISVDNVLRTTSVCPYCGQKLAILIPDKQISTTEKQTLETQDTSSQNKEEKSSYENKEKKQSASKSNKWSRKIIFTLLFAILLIGSFLSFSWYQQYQRELVRIERQHHRDSVMKVEKCCRQN